MIGETGDDSALSLRGVAKRVGGLTVTSPASFTTRALIALDAEAILTVITVIWLHRKPAPRTLSAATRAAPKRRPEDRGADCRSVS
jgi:hypothetical protein